MNGVAAESPVPFADGRDGLVSLADMINCNISSISALAAQLMLEQLSRSKQYIDPTTAETDKGKERILGWMKIARIVADEFGIDALSNRIPHVSKQMGFNITVREVATECRVLRETLDDGLRGQLVYRYPSDKSAMLTRWQNDWAAALGSFPEAREDILASVDLWSLSYPTASVFHSMRVLEHGLRWLAGDVGLVFEDQVWYNVINEIEAAIKKEQLTLPKAQRRERLHFLSEAAKEFSYFKDGWRNYVSHNRCLYDEHQARSVMEHVRSFMAILSGKVVESLPQEAG